MKQVTLSAWKVQLAACHRDIYSLSTITTAGRVDMVYDRGGINRSR